MAWWAIGKERLVTFFYTLGIGLAAFVTLSRLVQYSFHCKKQGKYKSLRSSSEWRSRPCRCRRTPHLTCENQIEGGHHQWKMLVSCTVFLAWLTMDSCPSYKHVLRLLNQWINGSLSYQLSWYENFWNMWENFIIQFVAVCLICSVKFGVTYMMYDQAKGEMFLLSY